MLPAASPHNIRGLANPNARRGRNKYMPAGTQMIPDNRITSILADVRGKTQLNPNLIVEASRRHGYFISEAGSLCYRSKSPITSQNTL